MLRSLFISLSNNTALRKFSESTSLGRKIASRFVAGSSVEEAADIAEAMNRGGIEVTLDALGESVLLVSQAEESSAVYERTLHEIAMRGLRANISLKLTQMGIGIGGHGAGPALVERIVGNLVAQAASCSTFVCIDMEGSEYTEATLQLTEALHRQYPGSVGTVLQAYLFRSEADLERLLEQGIRVRLCKGAYGEPPDRAFAEKAHVDENYVRLMKRAVTSGVYCGMATHDEAIIEELCRFIDSGGAEKDAFEFQMLYGIRRDLQRSLVAQGYRVRVYVPFGTEWYPYFMRRLAERPANVLFVMKNLFRF